MRHLVVVVGFGLGWLSLDARPVRAAEITLESAALRLSVSSEPYWYRLTEKATGKVLLAQSATRFTVADTVEPVRAVAAAVSKINDTTIDAQLTLEGSSTTGRATFRFVEPEVLEVELVLEGTGSRRINEEFDDQQEHVYGIWEYPFDGALDNRGQDHEYLGLGRNPGSLYTSGRAPFYVTSRGYGVYARSSARGRFTIAVAGKTGFCLRRQPAGL